MAAWLLDILRRWRRRIPLEAGAWAIGLGAMATLDPTATNHFSLCLFDWLGLPCPGTGLGHAIAHLVRGHVAASVQAHPLGLPAVLILLHRIALLLHEAWHRPPPPSFTEDRCVPSASPLS